MSDLNPMLSYIPPDDSFLPQGRTDGRRRIVNAMLAAQYDRPTPQDTTVTERAGLLPIGTYANGMTGLAFPGFLADPVAGFAREATNPVPYLDRPEDEKRRTVETGFDVAGAAMVGGLAAPKPSNAVGMFGGRLAKTANHAKLAQAEDMAARGVPREQIWNDTGWFKGVDDKWRFEIDDSKARTLWDDNKRRLHHTAPLSKNIDHPSLFDAYPSIGNESSKFGIGFSGGYFDNAIGASPRFNVTGPNEPKTLSIGLHEIQHGIQQAEGFARGGNEATIIQALGGRIPKKQLTDSVLTEAYRRLAGETEARAVQARRDLTPEQRSARPPWLDYDVPEVNQIVRFGNDGQQMSMSESRPGAAAGAALSSIENQVPGIRAYHGSPHDFDRFDMSKIGTGEGAQAFGHGLYFAESEGVAQSYKGKLTTVKNMPLIGQNVFVGDAVKKALERHNGNRTAAINELEQGLSLIPESNPRRASMETLLADLKSGKTEAGLQPYHEGRMYEVNIKANPEDFLDWDKPLSQQSEKVREAVGYNEDLGKRYNEISERLGNLQWQQGGLDSPEWTSLTREARTIREQMGASGPQYAGEEYARSLLDTYGKQGAAQKMREAGIPGIRYLDQGSRTAGEGSRNYVVFDNNLIEILRKYGLLGMAGGAAVNEMLSGAQEQRKAPWSNAMLPGDA